MEDIIILFYHCILITCTTVVFKLKIKNQCNAALYQSNLLLREHFLVCKLFLLKNSWINSLNWHETSWAKQIKWVTPDFHWHSMWKTFRMNWVPIHSCKVKHVLLLWQIRFCYFNLNTVTKKWKNLSWPDIITSTATDKSLLWHEYITNKKENYLKKRSELAAIADIFRRSK